MFDFYQRRKLRSILASRLTQAGILVVTGLVAFSALERYQIAQEMRERREVIEAQTAALEARKEELEQQVRYLSSDRGIEAEMRRQFDVAREGEQVVVILEDDTAATELSPATTALEAASEPTTPWYQFWR